MGTEISPSHHVLLFPFMSKGHTIPLLHLSRLLLRRGIAVTLFTTPGNRPFIAKSLAGTSATIIDIPYPQNVPEIPPGVESTDALPSISLYFPFCRATKLMQEEFERKLQSLLPPVSFMVSDGFLWWTLESATKFGFPRLVFYGMGQYASNLSKAVYEDRVLLGPESNDELITVPQFPWIKVCKNDFDPQVRKPDPNSPQSQLFMDQVMAAVNSYGMIVNTFYELEKLFIDHWNSKEEGHKIWCVGPLCLAEPPKVELHEPQKTKLPSWIKWLDQKLESGCSVLYVAFGSQADISAEQLKEIGIGLEESKVNFLWVIRKKEMEFLEQAFEERVKGRGLVVREWVDQREILMHQSVEGFLSHCGWNSVLESICAGVPILAWPMLAEQPSNAKFVAEEVKIGLRVDEKVRSFVKWERLAERVRELMEGEKGKEVRKKVKEVGEMAKLAMEEKSGSSWQTLDKLIIELCNNNTSKNQ